MKKEKTIRTYQRRTKTGKVVTVKQHTAKYDAAEALREATKKKGAGDEIAQRKLDAEWKKIKDEFMKKHPDFEAFDDEGNETKENAALTKKMEAFMKKNPSWKGGVKSSPKMPKEKSTKPSKAEKAPKGDSSYGFTADDYKAWYHWDQDADPKNKAALKVERALKKRMGAKAYQKYFDEMSDSYSARGHSRAFRGLGERFSEGTDKKSGSSGKEAKTSKSNSSKTSDTSSKVKEAHAALKEKGYKRYTYNGEVYYATKSGSLKQVGSDGKVRNVVPFTGARGTQESALIGWKRRSAEEAKAKRDKADAKKYRESLKSESSKSKTPRRGSEEAKGHPKVMAQIDKLTHYYQKEIGKIQKHIDAGERGKSRMSYKQQKKYAEGLLNKLEKGRDAHLSGNGNRAWHYLREFVGFNENSVIGKEAHAKNKVTASKSSKSEDSLKGTIEGGKARRKSSASWYKELKGMKAAHLREIAKSLGLTKDSGITRDNINKEQKSFLDAVAKKQGYKKYGKAYSDKEGRRVPVGRIINNIHRSIHDDYFVSEIHKNI